MEDASETRWVASHGVPPRILGFGLMLLILAFALVGVVGASVGGPALVRALELQPSGSIGVAAVAVVWAFGVGVPVILVVGIISAPEVRIGLGPEGLELRSRIRRRRLTWDELWPSYTPPGGRWVLVRYRKSERKGLRYFWATREQALAIALHPKAPFNLFPPATRDWLGVPPTPSAGTRK